MKSPKEVKSGVPESVSISCPTYGTHIYILANITNTRIYIYIYYSHQSFISRVYDQMAAESISETQMTEHNQTQKSGMQQGPAMSVRQAWEDLKGETTAHGLSKLKLENSRPKRIVWMVVLLCTLSVLSYHLSKVVSEYLANEVNVDLKIVSNRKSDFPAVTICNANAVRASSSGVLNNILNNDEKSRNRRSINSLIFDINKPRKPIIKDSHNGSHGDENVEKQISRFGVNNKLHNVDSKNLRPTQNLHSKGSGMSQKESNSRLKYDQSYKSPIRHKRSPGGGSCMNNTACNNSTCTTSMCECDRLWHGGEFCADRATMCESTWPWNSSSAALTSTEVYVSSGHEYVNTALVCSPGYILQSGQLSIDCEDGLWHGYDIKCSAAMATTPASQSLSVAVNTSNPEAATTTGHMDIDIDIDIDRDVVAVVDVDIDIIIESETISHTSSEAIIVTKDTSHAKTYTQITVAETTQFQSESATQAISPTQEIGTPDQTIHTVDSSVTASTAKTYTQITVAETTQFQSESATQAISPTQEIGTPDQTMHTVDSSVTASTAKTYTQITVAETTQFQSESATQAISPTQEIGTPDQTMHTVDSSVIARTILDTTMKTVFDIDTINNTTTASDQEAATTTEHMKSEAISHTSSEATMLASTASHAITYTQTPLAEATQIQSDSATQRTSSPKETGTTTAAHTTPSWSRDDPPMTTSFAQAENITYDMAQLNASAKQALGYQIEDMLFDCEYDGQYCSITDDFVEFYNPFLGNCFTFNSHWKNGSIRPAVYTGRRYGLHLSINVDQDEYGESTASNLAGVLVLIHNRHKMPFPEDEGVMLMTGQFALIGIRKVKIKRQPSPYSDCIQNHDPTFSRDVYEEFYPVQYDKSGCLKTCRQKYIIETCHCASAYYPTSGIAFGGEGNIVDVCNISNNDTSDCLNAANTHFNNADFECNCPSACKEEAFHPTISKAAWPTAVNERETISQLKSAFPDLYENSQNRESDVVVTRNNFIRLSVYFQDLRYEQITEVPVYTWPKFLADLGSCIGLWMGFSILTIVEFVEFGVHALIMMTKGRCTPGKGTLKNK